MYLPMAVLSNNTKHRSNSVMDHRDSATPPAFSAFKIFSWIVLALMVTAMLYAGWLSISNWAAIRV